MEVSEAKLRKFANHLHSLSEDRRRDARRIHESPSILADRDHKVIALNNQAEGLFLASMKLLEFLAKEQACKTKHKSK